MGGVGPVGWSGFDAVTTLVTMKLPRLHGKFPACDLRSRAGFAEKVEDPTWDELVRELVAASQG